MKRFSDLTPDQQEKAVQVELGELVGEIIQGAVRFNDTLNGDGLQAAIDAAVTSAERLHTPWFAAEAILDARYKPMDGHVTDEDGLCSMREALEGMARCRAEDTMYLEAEEFARREPK